MDLFDRFATLILPEHDSISIYRKLINKRHYEYRSVTDGVAHVLVDLFYVGDFDKDDILVLMSITSGQDKYLRVKIIEDNITFHEIKNFGIYEHSDTKSIPF